jgi:hypothetical protein
VIELTNPCNSPLHLLFVALFLFSIGLEHVLLSIFKLRGHISLLSQERLVIVQNGSSFDS